MCLSCESAVLQGKEGVAKHFSLLETVRQAMTTTAMGAALLKVEAALHEAGRVSEEWSSMWQEHWRTEIATCSHLQDTLLYVAALQVVPPSCLSQSLD